MQILSRVVTCKRTHEYHCNCSDKLFNSELEQGNTEAELTNIKIITVIIERLLFSVMLLSQVFQLCSRAFWS